MNHEWHTNNLLKCILQLEIGSSDGTVFISDFICCNLVLRSASEMSDIMEELGVTISGIPGNCPCRGAGPCIPGMRPLVVSMVMEEPYGGLVSWLNVGGSGKLRGGGG